MYQAHLPPKPVSGFRLSNFALAVNDLDAMIRWYTTVFDFTMVERGRFDAVGAEYAMVEASGLRIELVSRPGALKRPVDRTPPPDHLGVLGWKALVLETDDLPGMSALLAEHRVETVWVDQQLAEGLRSTMIRDPEGNLINIFGAN
ncbi:VOC family protein [Burkholderia sp. PU8-34]